MQSIPLLDRAGRRRSPATKSSFHIGVPPRNKGLRYPPDPPSVEEIIAVMRAAGDSPDGVRLRGVIVVLWRAGLRISEALAFNETDLDANRGALLVRRGLCRIRHSPWRIKSEPRRSSMSVSFSANASEIRSPPRHRTATSARTRSPWRSWPAWRITSTISSARGRSGGYRMPLLRSARPARYPAIVAGDRRRQAAFTRIVEPEDMTGSLR